MPLGLLLRKKNGRDLDPNVANRDDTWASGPPSCGRSHPPIGGASLRYHA